MLQTTQENQKDIGFMFKIQSFKEAKQLAEIFSREDMVPKEFIGKPNRILIAWQYGHEIGLKPSQSLNYITVINGRPCVWGDGLLGLIQAHPDFQDIEETVTENVATCKITRKGKTPCVRTFSLEEAKKAGLYGDSRRRVWMSYTSRMLMMRARAFAIRDSFADVVAGVKIAEEVLDYNEPKATNEEKEYKSRTDFIKDKLKKEEDCTIYDNEITSEKTQEQYNDKVE